jgi:hypothetical protein
MNVADVAGLVRLRPWVGRLDHDGRSVAGPRCHALPQRGACRAHRLRDIRSGVGRISNLRRHKVSPRGWPGTRQSAVAPRSLIATAARPRPPRRRHHSTIYRHPARQRAAGWLRSPGSQFCGPSTVGTFQMTILTSPASPGAPQQVVAESPVRAPLAGFIPWSTPTLSIPIGNEAQIRTVSNAAVEHAGGPVVRR